MRSIAIGLSCLLLISCSSSTETKENGNAQGDSAQTSVRADSVKQATNMVEFLSRHTPSTLTDDSLSKNDEYALLATEHIGGMWIGMGSADVEEILGTVEMRGAIENWGIDGLNHQNWQWPRKGVTLGMSEDTPGNWVVHDISMHEGCPFTTARGIRLGSTAQEVRAIYVDAISEEFSSPALILAGSIYGGISFGLEGDKVTSISLGAFAE